MGRFADMSEAVEKVMLLFQGVLNVEIPSADTDLIETGLLDSLMLVDLLVAIENQFNVRVPVHQLDIEEFRNAQRLAEMLQRRLAENDAA